MEKTHFQKRIALLDYLANETPMNRAEMTKVINGMSFFLSEISTAYHYNESYLNSLTDDFMDFLNWFKIKGEFVQDLFESCQKRITGDLKFSVKVDEIWAFTLPAGEVEVLKEGSLRNLSGRECLIQVEFSPRDGNCFQDTYLVKPTAALEKTLTMIFEPYERGLGLEDDRNYSII